MESVFSKRKKEDPFLVLDIGTEAIKALLVKKNSGKILILNSCLRYFDSKGLFDKDFLRLDFEFGKIKRMIDEVKKEILTGLPGLPRTDNLPVVLSLNPKMLRARVVEGISVRQNKEKKISRKEQAIIYKYVLKSARDDIFRFCLKAMGIASKDIEFICLEIMEKQIGGYAVSDISGHQGKDLNFKILAVFIPRLYLLKIKELLEDSGLKVVKTVHLGQAINALSARINNGIFLDLGGEISQAFQFKGGTLCSIKTFDRGGSDFTERIFDVLMINRAEARALKERYSDKSLSLEAGLKIKQALAGEKNKWKEVFENYLKSVVFLFGGASSLLEIRDIFSKGKFLKASHLKGVEGLDKKTKNPQFIPAILFSLINLQ